MRPLTPQETRKRDLFLREAERGMPLVHAAYPHLDRCAECPLKPGTTASDDPALLAYLGEALVQEKFAHCTGSRMLQDAEFRRFTQSGGKQLQICTGYAALVGTVTLKRWQDRSTP